MTADYRLCPMNEKLAPGDSSISADPRLLAEGWVRRSVTDQARIQELTELYTLLGFEVLTRKLTPDDFGPACAVCTEDVCGIYMMIYTRKQETSDRPKTPL